MATVLIDPQEIIRTHVKKSYAKAKYAEPWRNLPEIPDKSEIIPDIEEPQPQEERWDDYQHASTDGTIPKYSLPENITKGPWPSKAAYIGAHYQILREDAIASLRKSVAEFKDFPDMDDSKDTHVYTDIHIVGLQLSRAGAAFRIEFSTDRAKKQIRWGQSKRLQQGTLVALSPQQDMFESICKIAVVAARPIKGGLDQNPPQVDLFWGNNDDAFIDPTKSHVMIEAHVGYFESSRHMLVAMQKLMTEQFVIPPSEIKVASDSHSFPLSNHLVGLDKHVKHSSHLISQPFMDLSSLVGQDLIPSPTHRNHDEHLLQSIQDLCSIDISKYKIPAIPCTSLETQQLRACLNMITQGVAIVQGPPGTGKTFVSVKALQVMLENMSNDDPPIIVAAQTNHALDQLLTHISKFEPNFLRLGGRCDKANEVIAKRTLYEVRSHTHFAAANKGMKSVHVKYNNIVDSIKLDLGPIVTETFYTEEVLYREGILTKQLYESLSNRDWVTSNPDASLASWLGEEMTQIERTPSINMGFELEEDELEYEQRDEEELELDNPGDSDIDALSGTWVPIKLRFTGKSSHSSNRKAANLLESCSNLYDIPIGRRGEVYRCLEHRLNNKLLAKLKAHLLNYEQAIDEIKITRGDLNVQMIKHDRIKIIGCTTTGLSKYRAFLSALQPRTLLIEEAAETLEGTILAAMFESLDQLILVGDHQQLQAHNTVAALGQPPYNLAVSMFERLVNNGFPFVTLSEQRRMIMDIRKLLCVEENPFYSGLVDHPSVLDRVDNRKPIPGMGGIDTYWFHHTWPESENKDSSKCNFDEAEMIVGFFIYLVLNGTEPSKITILTFYNGQRKAIIRELRKHPSLRGISFFHVYTVDSYQGEENDVILLSMVRSNTNLTIGFLENRNRFVVALSRARRGLYIFGNAVTLSAPEAAPEYIGRDPLFRPIIESFRSDGRFDMDGGLPVTCLKHGKVTEIFEAVEWQQTSGGCHDISWPLSMDELFGEEEGRVEDVQAVERHSEQAQTVDLQQVCRAETERCQYHDPRLFLSEDTYTAGEQQSERRKAYKQEQKYHQRDLRSHPKGEKSKPRDHGRFRSKDESCSDRKPLTPSLFRNPHQGTPLRDSEPYTPTRLSLSSKTVSTPSNWQQWDAKKADEEAAKIQKEAAATSEVDQSRLVFRDKHTAVIVDENGVRRKAVAGSATGSATKTIWRQAVEPSKPEYSQVSVPSSSVPVQQQQQQQQQQPLPVSEKGPFGHSFSHSSEKAIVNFPAHVRYAVSTKVPDLLSSSPQQLSRRHSSLSDLEALDLRFKPLIQSSGKESHHSNYLDNRSERPNNAEKLIDFSNDEDECGLFAVGDLINFD
ncbi:hypothetical protein B7494_g6473 [Chlorociboria aeruginascens]|nr:hypothetical protein B7494_g6473 [Chlorociboria aeruginascens]